MFRKDEQENKIKEEVENKLKELTVSTAEKFGLPVSVRIEKGKVYEQILRVSVEVKARFIIMGKIDADLIMIMTHRESNFNDHYLGRFANEIINRSDIPVMTMTPSDPKKGKKIVKTFVDPFGIFGKSRNK